MRIVLVLIVLILSTIAATGFEESDCACQNGATLTKSRTQSNLLSCEYEGERGTSVPRLTVQVWTGSDEAKLERAKGEAEKSHQGLINDKIYKNVIEEYSVTEDRVSLIYKADSVAPTTNGRRSFNYKNHHITLYAENWKVPLKDIFDRTEACMRKAIDEEPAKPAPGKVTLTLDHEGRPLKNLIVRADGTAFRTNDNGVVSFDESVKEIAIVLTYYDDKEYFSLTYGKDNPAAAIRLDVREGKILGAEFDAGDDEIKVKVLEDDLGAFDITKSLEGTEEPALHYLHFQEALEFYRDLGVGFEKPVKAVLGVRFDKVAAYQDGTIIFDGSVTDIDYKYTPFVHYHEFSHYAMDSLYGATYDGIIKEVNHGGFANPTTADSWAEGFASFMAVVIANHHDRWWAKSPLEKSPAYYPPAGTLDAAYLPWEYQGKAEEFAVASVLWDLLDSKEDSMPTEVLQAGDIIFQLHFRGADTDGDGEISKEELAYSQIERFGDSAELDHISQAHMIPLAKELESLFDATPDLSLIEKHDNGDGSLSQSELLSMSEIIDYPYPETVVKEWLEAYDEDADGSISKDEATGLLKGVAIIRQITGGKKGIDRKGMEALASRPEVQDHYWVFTYDSMTLERFIAMMKENVATEDDDTVTMGFSDLWEIMKAPHKDFSSFLEGFEGQDEELLSGIHDILVTHGMYLDHEEGDKEYNKGEAFIDANNDGKRQGEEIYIDYPKAWQYGEKDEVGAPSNYERPLRTSTPEFHGHRVKGAQEISYILWDDGRVRDIFTVSSDGYVPVPPGTDVFVRDKRGNVVRFTHDSFVAGYPEVLKNGYILKKSYVGELWILLAIPVFGAVMWAVFRRKK